MAQRHLELSCERFRNELNAEDDNLIRTASLEDVRTAIAQTERELASRQGLRNFDRLSPYINAVERYGAVVEVFCNSSPIVPFIWVSAPPLRESRPADAKLQNNYLGSCQIDYLGMSDLLCAYVFGKSSKNLTDLGRKRADSSVGTYTCRICSDWQCLAAPICSSTVDDG